jgi:hypothetical protein
MSKLSFTRSHAIARKLNTRSPSFAGRRPRNSPSPRIRCTPRLRKFQPDCLPNCFSAGRTLSRQKHGLEAASARIGVAKAAFFPTIKLTSAAGLASADLGTLVDWPSRIWSVGPSIHIPIFEGRRNRANLKAAEARYEQTVASYRNTILICVPRGRRCSLGPGFAIVTKRGSKSRTAIGSRYRRPRQRALRTRTLELPRCC